MADSWLPPAVLSAGGDVPKKYELTSYATSGVDAMAAQTLEDASTTSDGAETAGAGVCFLDARRGAARRFFSIGHDAAEIRERADFRADQGFLL